MQTRSQQYALTAWDNVQKRKKEWLNEQKAKDQYGGMAHKLPVLIQTCGLMQALTFAMARDAKPHYPYRKLLDDLADTMKSGQTRTQLHDAVRQADLMQYVWLTQQAMEALLWFKRFAQSELDVQDAGAAETDASAPDDEVETAGDS